MPLRLHNALFYPWEYLQGIYHKMSLEMRNLRSIETNENQRAFG
jgi:hypothetical protein